MPSAYCSDASELQGSPTTPAAAGGGHESVGESQPAARLCQYTEHGRVLQPARARRRFSQSTSSRKQSIP